ncbi:hypothetical protein EJB05_49264, partial [Eragrostis curvula]
MARYKCTTTWWCSCPFPSSRKRPITTTLSSPRTGKHKGLVRTCSREEDRFLCCFCCPIVSDVEPRPFDPADVYQQMKIVPSILRGQFKAEAVANDGIPYKMYRKFWRVYAAPKNLDVGEALGLDAALRSRLLSVASLLGEHGVAPPEQMDRGAFYEVTLEQRWEPVHGKAVRDARGGSTLASKKALIGGSVEAEQETGTSLHEDAVGPTVWEEHRTGWVDKDEDAAGWRVERFVLKRMNGMVVVTFVHLDKIRAKQVSHFSN